MLGTFRAVFIAEAWDGWIVVSNPAVFEGSIHAVEHALPTQCTGMSRYSS